MNWHLKRRTFLSLLAANCVSTGLKGFALEAPAGSRQVMDFDAGWRFSLGDFEDAHAVAFDDYAWRVLDVPHDWGIEGEYEKSNPGGALTGYLPSGIGWYRKTFEVPANWQGKNVSVHFDAVFMNSTVWINGHKLGTRPYGYISFVYELSQYLQAGKNVIAVRVDNALQPAARWYTGSGIYSHVRLMAKRSVSIAEESVFVRTTELSARHAVVRVSFAVRLEASLTTLIVRAELIDSSGLVVGQARLIVPSEREIAHDFTVADPQPWSPDSPSLYSLRLTLFNEAMTVDSLEISCGIRTTAFTPECGFLLNGEPLKLRGVAEHYCAGAVGVAIPDGLLELRLRQLKEMGVNAIRTAHHPRPPVFYRLCDKIGLMVMNELFDGWHKKAEQDYGARFFATWWQRDATDCVLRDRNHPCIVAWSIGNETGHADTFGITKLIHSLDGTRRVTGGQVLDGVDVAGFNGSGGTPGTLEAYRKKHPEQPIVLTEEPHTLQTRGFYRVLTWWRDKGRPRYDFPPYGTKEIFFDGNAWYNSSYDNASVRMTARTSWKRTQSWPWLAGEFRWTGFDYLGEAGFDGENWPARMWNYGVIDLAGLPKDDFYLYKAFWTKEPMVHLLPHWTHPDMDSVVIPVVAYSNAKEVELFLNGVSLGRRGPEPLGDFRWQVSYMPGELKAIAWTDGKDVARTSFSTAGNPVQVLLASDNSLLHRGHRDIAIVTFSITDTHGVIVPWAMNRVSFRTAGPVQTLGYENGDPLDITPSTTQHRRAFYGLGRGFFRSNGASDAIGLVAFAVLGDELFPVSTTVALTYSQISLRGQIATGTFEMRYTLDGSTPHTESALYTHPFSLDRSAHVRALLLRNGEPFLETETNFVHGRKPHVDDDPRGHDGTSDNGSFAGPFSSMLFGNWQTGDRIIKFCPDGTIHQSGSLAGWWWYGVSLDVFESPNDAGAGQLRWLNSKQNLSIHLTKRGGNTLQIDKIGKTELWKKAP